MYKKISSGISEGRRGLRQHVNLAIKVYIEKSHVPKNIFWNINNETRASTVLEKNNNVAYTTNANAYSTTAF